MNTAPFMQDEAMRLENSSTQVASYNSAPFDFGLGFAPNFKIEIVVKVKVSALTTGGGQTYTHKIQESDDAATWTDASPTLPIVATGPVPLGCTVSSRYLRRVVTIGGGGPSITNEAWLNPQTGLQ